MKILLSIPNPNDGTAYYRALPYYKLGHEITTHNPVEGFSLDEIYNVDVVFFQRPANQIQVTNIEICKKYNIPVIVDYDDYGFDIDETNPAYEFYSRDDKQACMKECIKLADVVTVSTQYLKECLLEIVPNANITVIPNAADDSKFSVEPSYHERNKVILLRGGGSHGKDWEEYKDAIIQIMEEHPDYTLAVMGFHPEWLRQIKNVKYFKFSDILTYFDTLMQLKPELMIVPLQDTKFNRCKSNIAWIEGTLAGATVLATDLPEFKSNGCYDVTPKTIYKELDFLINLFKESHRESLTHIIACSSIPRLSQVNELRKDLIESLTTSAKKYAPNTKQHPKATDQEFLEYAMSHGHTQDDPRYQEAHAKAVNYLFEYTNPKYVFEIGFGTGATLVEFLKKGVMAYGVETNPYSYQYFIDRYPMYRHQVACEDVTKEGIEVAGEKGDLLLSIEVFEHINMPEEWWDSFLKDLSKKFKYFYFSSTPYSDPDSFMEFWGHCNVRRTTEWISLFERNGWKFEKQPRILTDWDLIFRSEP